jgi:2-polyprenyl-3-methyl-5-hydroxy-6-metoxy-1,4-benzoquinol methylase
MTTLTSHVTSHDRRTADDPGAAAPALDPAAPPDGQRLEAFLARFGADQAAAMHLSTVVLGDQLGLYRALADGGPQTGTELAERTGATPRLVLEWLRTQAVSGYCQHEPSTGRFWLTPEQQACLADDGGPTFVAGGTSTVSAVHRGIEQVAAAFRGEGSLPWGDHDPGLFSGVARAFRPAFETHLVSSWIPALDGIDARLRAGGRVADVGCGFGASTVLIAQGYPAATVAGFDQHDVSIDTARRAAADAGVSERVTFEVTDAAALPGSGYDLVTIFNALHEMGDPVGVCRRVRSALADGGRVMLVEPLAADSLEANRTPLGRSFLSASTMICLPSALSQGGDRHLGAQAPDAEFAAVAREAGFSRFDRVAETPLHRVLQLTP